jgi:uncharacterized protein YraI
MSRIPALGTAKEKLMNRRMHIAAVVVAALAALTAPSAAVAADGATSQPTRSVSAPSPNTPSPCRASSPKTRHHHAHPTTRVQGRVVTRHHSVLQVRSGPGTGYRVIGYRRSGSVINLSRTTSGNSVRGNTHWYKLSDGRGYVSARYVTTSQAVPWR